MPEKSMTIDSWLHTRFTCPACGNVHTIPTEVVVIEEGALKKVPSVLKRIGLNGKGLLVADKLTFQAAGREVERVLKQNDVGIDVLLLDDPVKADERALKHVAERITLEHRFLPPSAPGLAADAELDVVEPRLAARRLEAEHQRRLPHGPRDPHRAAHPHPVERADA